MTVRLGDITFSDWVSLPMRDGWTDTFIFSVSALACLPPYSYVPLLKRLVAHTRRKRPSASLWVQVDSPGEWFVAELRNALRGLHLPFAVTPVGANLDYLDFSIPPRLLHTPSQSPPLIEDKLQLEICELRCLQALGRMVKGDEHEIASLASLSVHKTKELLARLQTQELVAYKTSPRIQRRKSKPAQMDLFPLWQNQSKGLSKALRCWGVPKGTDFSPRKEENLQQIGSVHRHIGRLWSAWLKSAWPQAKIWTGWSEVRIPGLSVIPDGLAWGRVQGFETLFWLEVGDEHKSADEILADTRRRLNQATELCNRSGIRLVFAQLSPPWVQKVVRWACPELSQSVAVVTGSKSLIGVLSLPEWGCATLI